MRDPFQKKSPSLIHDLSIGDAVALVPAGGVTTATLEGGADAVARLLTGRLTAAAFFCA